MACLLEDKECNDCGECNRCDLDELKRCDNCCMCLENQSDDMRTIFIHKDQIEPDKPRIKNTYHWKPPQKDKVD